MKTYRDIFPKLFQPMSSMPQALREHIRYPQDYFRFQAEKYLKYHMQVPVDFYNLEDLWSIPSEKFGQTGTLQPVEPYYVIMKLPGEDREEFILLLPTRETSAHNGGLARGAQRRRRLWQAGRFQLPEGPPGGRP